MSDRLLLFYGTECVHCHEALPLVEKVEKELKVKIERLETWHNSKNKDLLQKLDNGKCGGVPFFYNEKSKKWLCGVDSYEELKKWARGK